MNSDAAVQFGPEVGSLEGRVLPDDSGKHLLINLTHRGKDCRWPDYWPFGGGDVLVSAKWIKLMLGESERPDYYQFIEPVFAAGSFIPKEMGYKLLNLLDHVDCLDLEHSKFRVDSAGNKYITKTVLRHDAVDGLKHLFRIKGKETPVGVSRQLAEFIQKSDLTGMCFEEVELSLKPGTPGFELWLADRQRKEAKEEMEKIERRERLLLRKPDGTQYEPGDQYPVKPPEEGPLKEFPKSLPIPK